MQQYICSQANRGTCEIILSNLNQLRFLSDEEKEHQDLSYTVFKNVEAHGSPGHLDMSQNHQTPITWNVHDHLGSTDAGAPDQFK